MSADNTPTSPLDDATAAAPEAIESAADSPSSSSVEEEAEYAPPLPDDVSAHAAPVAATAAVSSTASTASPVSTGAAPEPTVPRTRGAAIVWGLLFAVIAAFGIWTLTDGDRREGAAGWITTLTPNTVLSLVLLTIGVLILVGGAVGLIRHAQRRAAPQR
ncbi:hypothetical protein ACYX8G_18310 [Microbacterium saperdae]